MNTIEPKTLALTLLLTAIGCGPKVVPATSDYTDVNASVEPEVEEIELPSADALFERNLQAMGGMEALEAAQSSSSVIRMEIPLAGMSGTISMISEEGRRLYVEHSLPGATEGVTVVDGDTAWSIDSLMGPRLIEGDELRGLKMDNDPFAAARHGDWYPTRETLALTLFNDEAAYQVSASTEWGKHDMLYFSVDSGLAIGSTTTETTAVGEMQITTTILEYANFSGIIMPSVVSQTAGPMVINMTIESVELNPVIDPALWVPPPEIVELIEEFQGSEE
jgi:hypothetical protein